MPIGWCLIRFSCVVPSSQHCYKHTCAYHKLLAACYYQKAQLHQVLIQDHGQSTTNHSSNYSRSSTAMAGLRGQPYQPSQYIVYNSSSIHVGMVHILLNLQMCVCNKKLWMTYKSELKYYDIKPVNYKLVNV